ncbi:hypothetical protein KFZ76_11025 [Methylovulum psychrotolerans]|uniref:DUF6169 family protein n=1 Tax=Methylovulum psychrotolerans TaxID=1704499 RepID=UPI001BFF5788|nr:DUF6169 family protein [Methylovulum psychrotolerans]MBT9098235.1 hypothetical protein [Methylovulum psychrotolerans]
MLTPYNWSFDPILAAIKFKGGNGAEYTVALKEAGDVYFSDYPAIKSLCYEVMFESSLPSCGYDCRVSITLADIVKYHLQKGKIIIFVCESRDEKQEARKKLFAKWFKTHGQGFEKHDFAIYDVERPYYLSLLLDADKHHNPQRIANLFRRAIEHYSGYKDT